MSTVMISPGQSGLRGGAGEPVETGFSYTERQPTPDIESVRVQTPMISARQAQHPQHLRKRVLRRIRGFLIEDQGGEARVAFVGNGEAIQYYLPSDRLHKSGIVAQNQPFEMDEVEIVADDGLVIVGYSFRPLAKPTDAFVDSIDLNDDLKRKRALIFQKFGKAQG